MCVWFSLCGEDCMFLFVASFHTTGMSYPKKSRVMRPRFSRPHPSPPWTFCQFSLQKLGSTNKTQVLQCGKEHGSSHNGCGGPVPRQQSSVRSRCGAEAIGGKNDQAFIALLETAMEGTFLKFISQGVTNVSVWRGGYIGVIAWHQQTHSHVRQSSVVVWILQTAGLREK